MNKVHYNSNGKVTKVTPVARSTFEEACFRNEKGTYANGLPVRNPGKTKRDRERTTSC